jgi:hypothetical protein
MVLADARLAFAHRTSAIWILDIGATLIWALALASVRRAQDAPRPQTPLRGLEGRTMPDARLSAHTVGQPRRHAGPTL